MNAIVNLLPPRLRSKYRRFARKLPVDPIMISALVGAYFFLDDYFEEEGGVIQWAKMKLGL